MDISLQGLKLFLWGFSPYDSNCKNILIAEKEWLRLFFLMLFFGMRLLSRRDSFFGGVLLLAKKRFPCKDFYLYFWCFYLLAVEGADSAVRGGIQKNKREGF